MKPLVFCREVLSEILMLAAVQEHVQSATFVLHQVGFTLLLVVDSLFRQAIRAFASVPGLFARPVYSHDRSPPRVANSVSC